MSGIDTALGIGHDDLGRQVRMLESESTADAEVTNFRRQFDFADKLITLL